METPTGLPPETEAKIQSLLDQKRKIDAIKVYREATGVGLKEAKEAVERIQSGGGATHAGPQVEVKGGCFGMLLILLAMATITASLVVAYADQAPR